MIIFSDLHLNEKTADIVFKEVFPGLKQAVLNDKDNLLVCLGDFYHLRYKIDVEIQNNVFDYFNDLKMNNIDVILLVGNHDQINEKGDHALKPFSELSNVTVIENPCIYMNYIWLPYRKDKQILIDFLNLAPNSDVVFIHHGIQGFEKSNSIIDSDGINYSFHNFNNVICGHYHKRQNIGNVYYVGSPYQINAGEANQEKGYMVYPTYNIGNTYYPMWITTNCGPKYYNFGELPVDKMPSGFGFDFGIVSKDILQFKKGDIIKVKAPKGVDLEKFRKSINIPEGVNCVVEPSTLENNNRLNVSTNDFNDYVNAYLDEFCQVDDINKTNLNRDLLFQVYQQLLSEL